MLKIKCVCLLLLLLAFDVSAQECNSEDVGNPAWRGGGSQGGNRINLAPNDDQCEVPIDSHWTDVFIDVDLSSNWSRDCANSIFLGCDQSNSDDYSYVRFFNTNRISYLDRTFSLDMTDVLAGQPTEQATTVYRYWAAYGVDSPEFILLAVKLKKSGCSRRTSCGWSVIVEWSSPLGLNYSESYPLPGGLTGPLNFDVIAEPRRNELGDVIAKHFYLQVYSEQVNAVMSYPIDVSPNVQFKYADVGYIQSESEPVHEDSLHMKHYIYVAPEWMLE